MQRTDRVTQATRAGTPARLPRVALVLLSLSPAGNAFAAGSMPHPLAVPAFFAGLAVAMMSYGLVQSVMLRDPAHRSFALAALGLAVAFGAPLLAPLTEYARVLPLGGFAFAGLFVARLLRGLFDLEQRSLVIARGLRAVEPLFAAALVAAVSMPGATTGAALYALSLAFAAATAAVLYRARRESGREAAPVLLAAIALVAGLAVDGAASLGWAPADVGAPLRDAAAAAMLVLLAAAFGQRMRARLREGAHAQSEALAGSEQLVETLQAAEGYLTRLLAQRGEEIDSLAQRLQESEQRHLHATHHDPLTGLANQLLLADRISQGVTRSKRHNCRVAVAVIDLDDFARVNDTYGREVGDLVLKSVGTRLCGIVRAQDTVARIGNDEFAVVLEEVFDPLDVQRVENAITTELAQPFHVNGTAVSLGASIGFAMFPDGGTDATALLRSADKLMRRAKRGKDLNRVSEATDPAAA